MNRTLTAAAALAAALGVAGMAQAQTNTNTATPSSPMTTSPSAAQPGMSGIPAGNPGPSGTQNPQTMTAPGATSTYGTTPQANTNQMNTGPQGTQTQASQMQGASQQLSQSQILQAQQQLKSAGLYRGSIDGVMGPETQTALTQFQREQGLPQTAQFDQQTMSRLNGSSTGGQSSTSTQPMTPYPTGTQNPATTNSTGGMSGTPGGATNR